VLERLAHRLGGPRVMALPLLRALAVVAGLTWVGVAPRSLPTWDEAAVTVLAFLAWSLGVSAALLRRPGPVLRASALVLAVDLAFALALIAFTGGAGSALFLALLLIAALQSYFYGIRRGVVVSALGTVGYLVVAWPQLGGLEWANVLIRIAMLIGTAVGVGVLADLETAERLKVTSLTAEAHARERFIRSVVEGLQEGVIALDPEGRVVAWNRAMERRHGTPAREAIGQPIAAVFPPGAWVEPLRRLLAGELEELSLEAVEHEAPARGRVTLNLKGGLLRDRGEPAGAVLLVEDITERVGLERSARQAEKLAALGTLAAGLAHELNNPVGIISSRVELMLLDADRLPADAREDLQVVHRHAQRVARIAQGLLSFARQSPGRQGPVDLNRLVEETALLVERPVGKEGVVLTRRLAPALPPVWGDANALQQVLVNLVTNARDAVLGAGGGEVAIETGRADGGVRLVVRDTGPGIPEAMLSRIFDPFFTTKATGTGLGLSISYGIVRDHRGTVDVQSGPGKGTTFVLTFPQAQETA
jgi:PAS domain S-box-containing protein